MLKKTQIAGITGVSKAYVSKVIAGEITGQKAEKIKELLALQHEDLLPFIANETFLEICNIAIMRAKSVEVRKQASILHEIAVKLIEHRK